MKPADYVNVPLTPTEEEPISPSHTDYQTFFERSSADANETTLLLAGPEVAYGNEDKKYTRKRPRRRVLSFAETVDAITLSWHDLHVTGHKASSTIKRKGQTLEDSEDSSRWWNLKKPKKTKQILRGVSGVAENGTMTAIMGASSAGKTTLLNVLASRNLNSFTTTGMVLVNGQALGYGMKAITAYSQQQEEFIGNLTVKEHLWFHARLRMDPNIPYRDRMIRIEEVLDEVGLRKCAHTYIGIPGTAKGISGGEMKRLSFASELMTNPPLMLCDEPTSGLDAFMAESVVRTLQSMARKGKTVLVTIHQPASEVYQLFDNILLLSQGQVLYMGPGAEALDFFQNAGYPCPHNFSPPDHFVHQMAITPGKEAESHTRVKTLIGKYKDTKAFRDLQLRLMQCDNMQDATDLLFRARDYVNSAPYKSSWATQIWVIVWRSIVCQVRDSSVTWARLMQNLMMALVIGVVYLQQDVTKQAAIANISGAFFIFLTNQTFGNFYTVLNGFPSELNLFFREHHTGMYRVATYFIAKNIAELPIFVILPTIFTLVTYFMIGLYPSADSFFIVLGVLVLVSMTAVSFGYMLSAVSGNVDIALAISPPTLLPFMLLGGYLLDLESLPDWLSWVQQISWFRHGFDALMYNEWSRVDPYNCSSTPSNTKGEQLPCLQSTQSIMQQYGFSGQNEILINIMALIVMVLVFRLIAFAALCVRAKEPKLTYTVRKRKPLVTPRWN